MAHWRPGRTTQGFLLWSSLGLAAGELQPPFPHYSLDGSGNNEDNPLWGRRMTPEKHRYGVCYADNVYAPRFVPDIDNPNSTTANYDSCVAQCQSQQVVANGTTFSWSFMSSRSYAVDAKTYACDYACNVILGLNVRTISNRIFTNMKRRQWHNPKKANDLHTFFGHYISHEMHHSRPGGDPWPYQVPACDAWWDPECEGQAQIGFARLKLEGSTGSGADNPGAPMNFLSSWLDANTIYGGDDFHKNAEANGPRFNFLRHGNRSDSTFATCKMRMETKPDFAGQAPEDQYDIPEDPNGYLQFDHAAAGISMKNHNGVLVFVGGDFRTNVEPGTLGIIHVFTRLHNKLCDRFMAEDPQRSPEENFWLARKWVIAYQQKVFFYEYVPALLGRPLDPYPGYDRSIEPAFDPYHTQAAMRYGHSEVNDVLMRLDETWKTHPLGHLPLREANFNPGRVLETGLNPVLRGLMSQPQGYVDGYIVDYMVNGVFEGPMRRPWTVGAWSGHCLAQYGSGATTAHGKFDLQATNIQRGRDMGLCGINTVRGELGLPAYSSWEELVLGDGWDQAPANDPGRMLAEDARALYGDDVDAGDFWVAGLIENHAGMDSNVGQTFQKILETNWARVRVADRFYFENKDNGLFTPEEVESILQTPFSQLIADVTGIEGVPDRAFFVKESQMLEADQVAPVVEHSFPSFSEFEHKLMLSPSFKLAWSQVPGENALDMAMAAPTAGWVGIGFAKNGSHPMRGSDMVVGRLLDGQSVVDDMYASDIAPPIRDVDRSPTGTDDLANTRIEQVNGVTAVYFRKPYASSDELWDRVLETPDGRVQMVFAYQPQGKAELEYHGPSRGYAPVQLFPPNCPGGKYLDPITMSCKTCGVGMYRGTDMPITVCSQCSIGFWSDALVAASCEACPGRSTTRVLGATGPEQCACNAGSFLPASAPAGDCEDCPTGMVCEGFNAALQAAPGYMAVEADATSVFKCLDEPSRCPGGTVTACASGREGVQCALCEDGMVPAENGTCAACTGGSYLPAIIIIILTIGGVNFAYILCNRLVPAKRSMSVLLVANSVSLSMTVLQVMSSVSMFSIGWPASTHDFFEVIRLVNFDIEVLSLGCFFQLDPVALFTLKLAVPLILCTLMLVAHVASVVLKYGSDFRGQAPVLLKAWGTVIFVFFLSITSTAVSPFACVKHPNGFRTVAKYPSVLCWEGGTHAGMIGVAAVGLVIPISFIAFAIWATAKHDQKVRLHDNRFLFASGFLREPFRPQWHWCGVAYLIRNALISLVPMLPDNVTQILVMTGILLGSLVGVFRMQPWRVAVSNVADAGILVSMLFCVVMSAFFVVDVEYDVLAYMLCFLVGSTLAGLLCCACYGLNQRLWHHKDRPFQFSLCHHSAGIGAFARLLKMELAVTTGVSKRVCLLSGGLEDLDVLLDRVGNRTETVVALCTKELFYRSTCVSQLVAAYLMRVKVMKVVFPGFTEPDAQASEFYTSLVDISQLVMRGMSSSMVQETMTMLRSCATIFMPVALTEPVITHLSTELVRVSRTNLVPESKVLPAASMPALTGAVPHATIADPSNIEAVAVAFVLSRLLSWRAPEQPQPKVLLLEDACLPEGLQKILFICTSGVLYQQSILKALLKIDELNAHVIPILADEKFRFPDEGLMQSQGNVVHKLHEQSEVAAVIKNLFNEVAVVFRTEDFEVNEATLDNKISEISKRLQGNIRLSHSLSAGSASVGADNGEDQQTPDVIVRQKKNAYV